VDLVLNELASSPLWNTDSEFLEPKEMLDELIKRAEGLTSVKRGEIVETTKDQWGKLHNMKMTRMLTFFLRSF